MKEPFSIFTLQEIKLQLKQADSFLERFENCEDNILYTLSDLGKLNGISPSLLATILILFEKPQKNELHYSAEDFEEFSLDELLNYVEITHEFYRKVRLKKIEETIEKLALQIGIENPLNNLLYDTYMNFRLHLCQHMKQEEEILFNYIYCLLDHQELKNKFNSRFLKSKLPECFVHHTAHDSEENLFNLFILNPSKFYNIDTTEELLILENELKSFKIDLEVHAWLEDEVLLPKTIALRNELFN